jgi:hypothetical protein
MAATKTWKARDKVPRTEYDWSMAENRLLYTREVWISHVCQCGFQILNLTVLGPRRATQLIPERNLVKAVINNRVPLKACNFTKIWDILICWKRNVDTIIFTVYTTIIFLLLLFASNAKAVIYSSEIQTEMQNTISRAAIPLNYKGHVKDRF